MSTHQLLKCLNNTIGHFKAGEVKRMVSSCIPELKWNEVMLELKNRKMPFSYKNLKLILNKSLQKLNAEQLTIIYLRLTVFDVAHHSHKKEWFSYRMQNPQDVDFDLKNLNKDICQGYRLNQMNCKVQSLEFDEIVWISVVEKKLIRRRGAVWQRPLHCAYFMNSNYVFLSAKVSSSQLKAFLHALHYETAKKVSLCGHDVKSLFNLLKKKESEVSKKLEYRNEAPRNLALGMDYSQSKSRLSFSESCFDDKSVKLETITFLGSKGTYQGLPIKMRNSFKISSSNAFLTLQKMMQYNAINPQTCPDQIKHLLHSGKNVLNFDDE